MKIKDCFYGQVRAVTETHHGTRTTWTPPALNVTKQCGVTWDNTTGMNPLHDQAPVDVTYYSYGEMLATAANQSRYFVSPCPEGARERYTFIKDFLEMDKTPEFYDNKAKDHKSHYARLAFQFAR